VPSKHSPADRSDTGREYPVEQVVEQIGEDPGRFLDRDLFEHEQVRLEGRDNAGYTEGHQRVVRDSDVSAPGAMIRDRIQGIDRLAVAASWMAVERSLARTPDGGRDIVIELLRDRIAELEEHGERPDADELARIAAAVRAEHPEWDDVERPDVGDWAERVGVAVPTRDDTSGEAAVADGGEQQ
jgi:hypothetical protein